MSSRPPKETTSPCIAQRIHDAQHGCREALGAMLDGCRQYLLLIANEQLDADLRDKLGPSDLVQETFVDARRDFGTFQGRTEQEVLAWLRRVLLNNLADVRRRFRGPGRDIGREVPLADASAGALWQGTVSQADSPGAQLVGREQSEALQRALEQLTETARRLIEWRNYDLCSFAEIGRRLGKSEEASRKAWTRAIEQLQLILEPPA